MDWHNLHQVLITNTTHIRSQLQVLWLLLHLHTLVALIILASCQKFVGYVAINNMRNLQIRHGPAFPLALKFFELAEIVTIIKVTLFIFYVSWFPLGFSGQILDENLIEVCIRGARSIGGDLIACHSWICCLERIIVVLLHLRFASNAWNLCIFDSILWTECLLMMSIRKFFKLHERL